MARAIGSMLPAPLLERLRATDLAGRVGIAVVIVTVDDAGWPHPAMLSYGELLAVDARRIRLATHGASSTAENLRRRGRVTLCFVEAGMAYYVKAAAAELPRRSVKGLSDLARFEATVETVLMDAARADSEPGATLVDGVRFSPGRPLPAVLLDWHAVLDGLKEEA